MKYPAVLSFRDVLPNLAQFDTIIDVRSPGEFAEDHIPGAVNYPVLDDEQRVKIGTMYKQCGSFEAKKLGAALVARNIANHIETQLLKHPHHWKPLVYCWRGGNRSGSMAHILAKIGWPVVQVDGGYKAYRHHVNEMMSTLPQTLHFIVLCGPTGSGKSHMLRKLNEKGAQVLDLEKIAAHRGSVLGSLPTCPQPSQKKFETMLWDHLRNFDPALPVFIESESKKVGNLRVPEALMTQMRTSLCVNIDLSMPNRVQLLMNEYDHFVHDPVGLNKRLNYLTQLHGKDKVEQWHQWATEGRMDTLVEDLLFRHYDPAYSKSIRQNFDCFAHALNITIKDISDQAFEEAITTLLAKTSSVHHA
ncbi:tRNA 2-selenouridine(34) synthase MnmH [Undibacterium sp. SXout7W]|uniref:tRNA 2-selenouridine(34) synthase MnmH n=1 Tax=Undibacterium sp. SXout7W TaxID=3413049 RepID=UPI003BF3A4ED